MLKVTYAEDEDDGLLIFELLINTDEPKMAERVRRLLRQILGSDADVRLVSDKQKKD